MELELELKVHIYICTLRFGRHYLQSVSNNGQYFMNDSSLCRKRTVY